MLKNLHFPVGFALALLLSLETRAFAVERDALALATASITKDELRAHVDVLSDDTFEGREAGSRGGRAAANYILKEFERLGATPAGENGTFFQSFHTASRNILGL